MNENLFFELGSAFDDLSKIFIALDLIVEDDRDFINIKNDIVKMCTDGIGNLNNPLVPSTVDELNKKYAENIRKTIFKYKKIILEYLVPSGYLEADECNLVPLN